MTSEFHDVQGAKVHVWRQGEGRPLLLLHGNPDSHRSWLPLIECLPAGIEAIAPDLPGFGESAVPRDQDISLDGQARWLDALLDALALEQPIDLMVHDIGGVLGLAWLLRHPERVRRVIVSNTIFHSDYRWHFWARVWRRPLLGELSMAMLGLPLVGRRLLDPTLRLGGPGLSKAQRDVIYRDYHSRARAQVLRLYRGTNPEKFAAEEAVLQAQLARMPVRVIWGRRDVFIPAEFAQRFATVDVHMIDDVGHWVAAEAPERVAALVAEHLQAGG